MSLESTLPQLDQVERQIVDRLRELRVLRSLRRILQRKQHEDHAANRNDTARRQLTREDPFGQLAECSYAEVLERASGL